MPNAVFGPIIGSWNAEQAMLTTLRERLPTYVDHIARHLRDIDPDVERFPIRPRTTAVHKQFAKWPSDRLPYVQVTSPGEAATPVREDEGLYTRWFEIDVIVVVGADALEDTRMLRSVWEDAVVACVMQHRSLGGFAISTDLGPQRTADVPLDVNDERTLQATLTPFVVEVTGTLDPTAGPAVFIPDPGDGTPDPYPDDPEAEEVIVDYTPIGLDEEIS